MTSHQLTDPDGIDHDALFESIAGVLRGLAPSADEDIIDFHTTRVLGAWGIALNPMPKPATDVQIVGELDELESALRNVTRKRDALQCETEIALSETDEPTLALLDDAIRELFPQVLKAIGAARARAELRKDGVPKSRGGRTMNLGIEIYGLILGGVYRALSGEEPTTGGRGGSWGRFLADIEELVGLPGTPETISAAARTRPGYLGPQLVRWLPE